MHIRACEPADLDRLTQLTIDVFQPFFDGSCRRMLGDQIFQHQHGAWADDYRRSVPGFLAPPEHKYVAIAEDDETDTIHGYVAWQVDIDRRHGTIEILAVPEASRRQQVARSLCEHVFEAMRHEGVEVVDVGTGGDEFHAPARGFYESLGMRHVPVAVYLRAL